MQTPRNPSVDNAGIRSGRTSEDITDGYLSNSDGCVFAVPRTGYTLIGARFTGHDGTHAFTFNVNLIVDAEGKETSCTDTCKLENKNGFLCRHFFLSSPNGSYAVKRNALGEAFWMRGRCRAYVTADTHARLRVYCRVL